MYQLSLFTGAGGGELGAILNGWHTVGYVEWDEYCQQVLAQRIKDGILPEAPIFTDINVFTSQGYALGYQGMVDIISAGFPCQPFSVAGKQAGADDPRNMWPATIQCLRIVRPRFALLENVPGLLATGYCGTIFRDLAQAGYDAKWCVLGADDCGANHRRKRLWILAYTSSKRRITASAESGSGKTAKERKADTANRCSEDVAHTDTGRLEGQRLKEYRAEQGPLRSEPDRCGEGRRGQGQDMADTQKYDVEGMRDESEGDRAGSQEGIPLGQSGTDDGWWATEPALGRVAHGVAHRVDRLKAIGNGQVPAVVKAVWGILKHGTL